MRPRHRVPSIFNLSMVDVLCCALGCLILLWSINTRDAKDSADKARDSAEELARVNDQLATLRTTLTSTEQDRTQLREQLAKKIDAQMELQKALDAIEQRNQQLAGQLTDAQKKSRDLNERLMASEKEKKTLEENLSTAQKDTKTLTEKLVAAQKSIENLEKTARELPKLQEDLKTYRARLTAEEALALSLKKDVQKHLLALAEAKTALEKLGAAKKDLEGDLADRTKNLTDTRQMLKEVEEKHTKLTDLLGDRVKDLLAAGRTIDTLQDDKKRLLDEVGRLRIAVERLFAGIALTGQQVVFLVDMSGSMRLRDKDTPAETKWKDVCDTLGRIMESLPNLKKFQIIGFAENTKFVLGKAGEWHTFDNTSVQQVVTTLKRETPVGGTNLHNALETAFQLKNQGLDTIYLLSDGLPNIGPIFTPLENQTLNESEKSVRLARDLRQKLQADWNRERLGQTRVRIHAVGFFYESPDVGAFLWALARENEGSFVGMSKP